MAKNMARLDKNNIVINIEWCSDKTIETETLVNIYDYPVISGDIYENRLFYRNGERVLSPFEELSLRYSELNTSYTDGVNSI